MDRSTLQRLPKAVLHEHLDGGLRPATILELAEASGYDALPETAVDALADWFDQGASGSLERYLSSFAHTVAVMQTAPALQRVAREAVEDLADDGVVYAEIRFAPSLHTAEGLDRAAVLDAVLTGLEEGRQRTGIDIGVIVDAMRHEDDSGAVAAAAVGARDRGVVGFDLAGPEEGHPPGRHRDALEHAAAGGLRLTIHAGEAAGVESIAGALEAGAERLGHGLRIIDDCRVEGGEIVEVGAIATRVVLGEITLELCPSSNVGTGAVASVADHPIEMLRRAGFPVTVNTDNRLMSRTTMTRELALLVEDHGWDAATIRRVTDRAVDAAFCDDATRERVRRRVAEGYAGLV
ncbi:MAG: adenosine deaminase [Acidimicrobiia bacterium]|nr:adenosine deaminase [Acidimicrobiia bacterium]